MLVSPELLFGFCVELAVRKEDYCESHTVLVATCVCGVF